MTKNKNAICETASCYSPIVQNGEVIEEKKISINAIHLAYKNLFNLDIGYLLPDGCQWVTRFKCLKSGYRFYEPACIVGDNDFYKRLQKKDWYYMPDKWEFREAVTHISQNDDIKVLEIGSAKGDFLKVLSHHNPDASLTGLELNQEAAAEARRRGYDVRMQLISEHAKNHRSFYDVIASFQVLEHISKPIDVLRDTITMLKYGGLFIIGVPDNSQRAYPSIFVKADSALNMPPHHQGLWDIPSLTFLTKVLPLRLDYIKVEPATAPHHSNSYRGLMKRDLLKRYGRLLGIVIYAFARPFYDHALMHLSKYLPAHTLIAVYTKNNDNLL